MVMQTRQLVPMVFVADLQRSIAFYAHLGFEVGNTFTPEGANEMSWAWLESSDARLMLALANEAIVSDEQRIHFYLYTDDVLSARDTLVEAGLTPGEITKPFYAPRGEFRLVDPDGYVLMITHT
jgi:catechol 2,3-dioxygenase-like lactoylglutathione lyase family enzyme